MRACPHRRVSVRPKNRATKKTSASSDPRSNNMPAGGQHTHMRGFSAEEDAHLASLMETMGPKWKTIAEAMSAAVPDAPPRTAAMVRNRFLRVQKGKREAEEGKARNKCGRCGALKKGHVCTVGKALALTPTMSEDLKTNTPHTVHESNDLPPIAESRLDIMVEQQDENEANNTSTSTLQLFAPPAGLMSGSCDRTAAAEYAAAELQLAAACWSPQTSPGAGVEPSPDITMASLLAPTPEGMVSYCFPTLPASLQAALSGAAAHGTSAA